MKHHLYENNRKKVFSPMLESQIYKYLLDHFAFLQSRTLYVFGAGYTGRVTVESLLRLGLNVKLIIDNDSSKSDSTLEGISINSLDSILESRTASDYFLLALEKYEEVSAQLESVGVSKFTYTPLLKVVSENTLEKLAEPILQKLLKRELYDINLQMQKDALAETAQFVKANMFQTAQYKDRVALVKSVLEQPLIKGLYLEFGVFQGHSINYISSMVPLETVHGFDSFEGLPESWMPGFDKGMFEVSSLPPVNSNVQLIKGWFNETLPPFLTGNEHNCAFIHVDCDLYSSTKIIFNELKNRIVDGTVIVFDEYFNYPNWKSGEFKAFNELIEETGLGFEYLGFVMDDRQVAVRITSKK